MSNPQPQVYTDHNITADALDRNAVSVVDTLREHDFEAYLVGGCVRDLLCGRKPKDFDVATNATPEQIKQLFRRARLVGRRFPIAHVRFGREIIEVSTFRQSELDHVETNDSGLIVKDRAFGTIAEDAFRRDFTINALYLDPQNHTVIDYVQGVTDIQQRRLQFIGEPSNRLAEDPVRMLRAIRFAAKLDFELEATLTEHFEDTAERLEAIPSARLFDEFLKMFLSGYGAAVWDLLHDTPLVRSLFPSCNPHSELTRAAMFNTDQRIAAEQPVTPGFLIAVLLWDDFSQRNERDNPKSKPGLIYDIAMDTLAVQQQHIAVPKRYAIFAREVWQLQNRLVERHPRAINKLLGHKRFRAAFDFLTLRAKTEPKLQNIAQWWHDIQEVDGAGKQQMVDQLASKGRNRNRRRRPRNPMAEPPYQD